jgi:hypothetical protein
VLIFSSVSLASSSRPERASASTYQNVQMEKVPSLPRRPPPDSLEFRVHLDHKFRLYAKVLASVAVKLLDAALGVATVATHVPLAYRTIWAGLGIGTAYDANNEVAWFHTTATRSAQNTSEGFVAKNETILPGRSPAVAAAHDLYICAAHAHSKRPDEHGTVVQVRLGHLF